MANSSLLAIKYALTTLKTMLRWAFEPIFIE